MRIRSTAPLLALLACLPAACATASAGGGGDAEEPERDALAALVGRYELRSLGGEPLAIAPGARRPDLQIAADGRVGGFAGVNGFGSQLDVAQLGDGVLALGPVIATRMAGPPEAMRLEQDYLGALEAADGFAWDGAALVLLAGGAEVARLERVE